MPRLPIAPCASIFSPRQCFLLRRVGTALLFGLLAGAIPLATGQTTVTASPNTAEAVTVDAKAAATPFPHYWEQMFGSGRAALTLRDSYRATCAR